MTSADRPFSRNPEGMRGSSVEDQKRLVVRFIRHPATNALIVDNHAKTTAISSCSIFSAAPARCRRPLLADAAEGVACRHKRERLPRRAPTRAMLALPRVHLREVEHYADWRPARRKHARQVLARRVPPLDHRQSLGVLPVYEELGADTLVVQFDAHLDIYHLSDCTPEPSHGNFLLHAEGDLPSLVGVGNRELLLPAEHVKKHYQATFSAADLAIDPEPARKRIRQLTGKAKRVFIDIDCDVFDPAFFPAVSHPLPFGLSPPLFLSLLEAAWSERVVGVGVSEFDTGRDRDERSLQMLVWLMEYLLLKRYE